MSQESPAELWERLVASGMSKEEATARVQKAIEWEQQNTDDPNLLQRWVGFAKKAAPKVFGAVVDPVGTFGRPIIKHAPEMLRQGARGMAEGGLSAAGGVTQLVGADEAAQGIRDYKQDVQEFYGEPETGYGQFGQVGGRLTSEAAMFAAPGTAVGRIAGATGKLGSLAQPATRAGRFVREFLFGAPIDAAIAASGREESLAGLAAQLFPNETLESIAEDPIKRAALEAAVGSVLGEGLALLPTPKARGAQVAEEAVPERPEIPEVLGGTKEELEQAEALRAAQGQQDLIEAQRRMRESERQRELGNAAQVGQVFRDQDARALERLRAEEAGQIDLLQPARTRETAAEAGQVLRQADEAARAKELDVAGRTGKVLSEADATARQRELDVARRTGQVLGEAGRTGPRQGRTLNDVVMKSQLNDELSQFVARGTREPEIKSILEAEDFLGFENRGQAGVAIVRHPDWAARWEVSPENVAKLEAWRAKMLDESGITEAAGRTKGGTTDPMTAENIAAADRARGDLGKGVEGTRLYSGLDPSVAARALGPAGAGGAIGAGVGAAADEENRLRGALVGGAGGALGGAALGARAAKRAPDVVSPRQSTVQTITGEAPRKVSDVIPTLGKKDFDVHIDRIREDPDGRIEIGERASRLKTEGVLENQRTTWARTLSDAESINVDPLLHEKGNRALTGPEGVAVRNAYNDNLAYLSKAYRDLERLSANRPEYQDLVQRIALMENRADLLLKRFVRGASQQGRDFNALKILANTTTDPFVWMTKLNRVMGEGEEITKDMRRAIFDMADKGDKAGLANFVQKHRKPLTWRDAEYWSTLVRAGMLTLPVSVGRALVGNTSRALYETASKPATVAADAIFSLITKKRTATFGGARGAKARLQGFTRGLKQSPAALRGEILEETLEKFDTPRNTRLAPIWGRGGWGDKYVRYVFGSQGAVDRPFREMARSAGIVEQAKIIAYHGSLEEQAKQMARLGVPADVSKREFIDAMVENPTAEMAIRAGIDAEHEVFQNKTIASAAGSGILRGVKGVSPTAAAGLQATVLPFVRTPSAVATIGIESTPLGSLSSAADLFRLWRQSTGDVVDDAAIRALQSKASKRAGRWGTGLLGVSMGYTLYASGRMTGPLPSSRSEREQWQAEGKRPYSILIGKRWHPVGQVQPLGAILAFGSGLAHSDESEHGPMRALIDPSAVGGASSGALRSLLDLPFISGIKDITKVLEEGQDKPIQEQVGEFVERKAGSVVPNVVAGTARAVDPVVREVNSVWEAIQARLPYFSTKLPVRPGLFGEQIDRERGTKDRVLFSLANVTGSRKDETQNDPLLAELQSIGYIVPSLRGKGRGEDPDTYRGRKQLYGRMTRLALEDAVNSPEYQATSQMAERYVQSDPRLAGVTPAQLADLLRREILGDAVSGARRELTTYLREAQNQ